MLGGDPGAVGRILRLNGRPVIIVGIGPKGFLGFWPGNPADLFVPVTCCVALAPELAGDPPNHPDREIFRVVFRLARGAAMAGAKALMYAVRSGQPDNAGLLPAGALWSRSY
jgi:hypothetical protein